MKKSYKIDVDCAACALKMEDAAKKVEGVEDCAVSLLTNSMGVEGSADPAADGFSFVIRNLLFFAFRPSVFLSAPAVK